MFICLIISCAQNNNNEKKSLTIQTCTHEHLATLPGFATTWIFSLLLLLLLNCCLFFLCFFCLFFLRNTTKGLENTFLNSQAENMYTRTPIQRLFCSLHSDARVEQPIECVLHRTQLLGAKNKNKCNNQQKRSKRKYNFKLAVTTSRKFQKNNNNKMIVPNTFENTYSNAGSFRNVFWHFNRSVTKLEMHGIAQKWPCPMIYDSIVTTKV